MAQNPGYATLLKKVQEHDKLLAQITPQQTQSPPAPISQSLFQIKTNLEMNKQEQSAATIEDLFNQFKQNMPAVTDLSTFTDLVEYAVDFVEDNCPTFMNIVNVFEEDKSPFKLLTCITLIMAVIPPTIEISEILIKAMINMIVKLKNKITLDFSPTPKIIGTGSPTTVQKKKPSLISKLGKK